jgi:type III secretory pathway lipoprotein EscJ
MAIYCPYLLAVVLLLAVSCTGAVRPEKSEDPEQPGVDELLGKSFLPNPQDEKLLREHAMAGELARSIGELNGVDQARVHLTLADRSVFSRDRKTETKAVLLVRHSPGEQPDAAIIQSLAVAVIPGLKADRIQLFFSGPEKAIQETVFVGPVEVVSSSVGTAKAWFGGLLALCALLALCLIGAGLKMRKTRLKIQNGKAQ